MRIKAFTLIELLIVSAIVAILALSIYSAFYTGTSSYRKIDAAFGTYQTARIIFNRLAADLKNSYAYADQDSKFIGENKTLDFFSVVDSYQGELSFRQPCRIKYELSQNSLMRTCFLGLEALKEDAQTEPEELSEKLKDITFEYGYYAGNPDQPYAFKASWPRPDSDAEKKTLPLAVKITLLLIEQGPHKEEYVVEFKKVVAIPLAEKITSGP